jgi:hypothetical protein
MMHALKRFGVFIRIKCMKSQRITNTVKQAEFGFSNGEGSLAAHLASGLE